MKDQKLATWLFFISVIILSAIFIVEAFTPFGVIGTVAYLLIVGYFLWLPTRTKYIILLAILTTIYIILGYVLSDPNSIITLPMTINRIVAVIVIWLAVHFSLRYRRFIISELKQSKNLNAVFENSTEGMLISNGKGEIITINKFAEQLFGYERQELLGKKVEILIPPRFTPRHEEYRTNFINKPQNRPMGHGRELYGLHKSGFEFPVEVSLSHFKSENEDFVVAFVVDISERKKASENLKKEKELAQMYLDIAPVIFLVLDQDGNIQLINQRGCHILGYEEEEILGKNLAQSFIPPHARQICQQVIDDFLNNKGHNNLEIPIVNKTAEERLIQWKGSVIYDLKNNSKSLLCSGEDITERKRQETLNVQHVHDIKKLNEELEFKVKERTIELSRALVNLENTNKNLKNQIVERKIIEEKLLSSQRLYKAIAHNFPDGIIGVLDRNYSYILVDGKELGSLGLSVRSLMGQHIFEFNPDHNEDYEKFLRKAFDGSPASFEVNIKNRIYNVVAVPLPDLRDEINEILVVIQNITTQKIMEEGLRKSLEKEKELGELKSRFVTMASHEFRTPLSTILSSVFLLENYDNETYEKEKMVHITRIKNNVKNLTEILNDFLSIGKLEEGKITINYSSLDLKEFVNDLILEMVSVIKKDQQIEYIHKGEDLIVHSDKQILKNILINLLSNAIKYSNANGKIKIISETNHQNFSVTISDQGIGIPESEQNNLFTRFFRAHNATNIQGTGLGLNIVKKYTELLQGTIHFQSELNKGTSFTVNLPARN
ncbi:hypothetical protein BH23BAC1_BH23BAC1_28620 [soil metagenome]